MTDANTGQPCPPWCVSGAEHTTDHLRRGSDFYHRGKAKKVPTTATTPNCEPIIAQVCLIQREHMDERGISRDPAEVVVDFAHDNSFLPDDAERLASVLNELASVAKSTQDSC